MSPEDLVKALSNLPHLEHPDLLVGPATLDDAGVVRLNAELALVQTVDFFPPVVDDPVYFGRIAAANALSDVYAMGGKPHSAVAIVGWPKALPPELLGEILRGGQEKIDEAGAVLAGGHTVTDSEIKYGLAVTGTIHPDAILTNAGAQAGDVLVLTKPLGMGAITTGNKKERVSAACMQRAMEVMATLNAGASRAALAAGAHAMTDVTGFGLLGHAGEMAAASRRCLEFEASAVPLVESALELAREGLLSGSAKRTRTHLDARLLIDAGIEEARAGLLLDAETSGGLLIAVPEDRADALLDALRAEKTPAAAIIGRVHEHGDALLRLRA